MGLGDRVGTSAIVRYTVVAFLVSLLGACAPWYIHIPPHLQETPLREEVRRELRWIPHLGRIAPTGRAPEGERDLVLFPRDTGSRSVIAGGDRTAVILEATDWLQTRGDGAVLVVVPEGDAPRIAEAQRAQEKRPHISVIALNMERDAEQGAAALQRAISTADPVTGFIMLSGATGIPVLVEYIIRNTDAPPVILELLFDAHGRNLRRGGVHISGAIVADVTETLKKVDNLPNMYEEIYMLYRFVRY